MLGKRPHAWGKLRAPIRVAVALWCVSCIAACSRTAIRERLGGPVVDAGSDVDAGHVRVGGSAAVNVEPALLDFRRVSCGSDARAKTITLTNRGQSALRFVASITSRGVFTLVGADARGQKSDSLAPGQSARLAVAVQQVASTARAGSVLTGTLEISTNAADASLVTVPLRVTPSGATLLVSPALSPTQPAHAAFGAAPLGQRATVALTIENAGNEPARFGFGAVSDGQFGLDADPSYTLAPKKKLTLDATFTPNTTAESLAEAPIVLEPSSPSCGASATFVSFEGRGTTSDVTASPGVSVSFGDVFCDAAEVEPQKVTLTNAGATPYTIHAELLAGASSPFALDTDTAVVPARQGVAPGTLELTIVPRIELASASPGALQDTLRISPVGASWGAPIELALDMTVRGAVLAFDSVPDAFTNVTVGGPGESQAVVVRNDGNLDAHPSLVITPSSNDEPFSVIAQLDTVAQGSTSAGSVLYQPWLAQAGSDTASLAIEPALEDHLCTPLPQSVLLSGSRAVGHGGLSLGGVTELFFGASGNVPCKVAAAGARTLSLANDGGSPLQWSATLAKGSASWFTLAAGLATQAGELAPGESFELTITPKKLPYPAATSPDFYGDTLTLTSNAAGDEPHVIVLHQTAQGAVIAFDRSALDFGSVPAGPVHASASANIVLKNVGNTPADVRLATSIVSAPSAAPSDAGFFLFGGLTKLDVHALDASSPSSQPLTFVPGGDKTKVGAWSGQLAASVDATTVLCADLPAPLTLTGVGTTSNVIASPSSDVYFTGPAQAPLPTPPQGFTYCGSKAGDRTLTLTNTGGSAVTITEATLEGQSGTSASCGTASAASSPYCLTAASANTGSVIGANGGTATFVIASKPVAYPTTTFDDGAFDETLSVTLHDAGGSDETRVFNLLQTPYGALLTDFSPAPVAGTSSFAFPATTAGGASTIAMALRNAGNAPATLLFSNVVSSVTGAFSFDAPTLAPFTTIPPNPPDFYARFTPPAGTFGTISGSASFGVTSTTALCADLPLSKLTMSGTSVAAPQLTVTPSNVSFNNVPCGNTLASPPSSTLTITNPGASAVAWTASIPPNANGSTFTLSSTSGTIPAFGSAQLTISAAPVPPSASFTTSLVYDTTLTLSAAGTSYSIPVVEQALGAVLWIRPIDELAIRRNRTRAFRVRNRGNAAATVSIAMSAPSGGAVLTPSPALPATVTLGAAGSGSGVTRVNVTNASAVGVRGKAQITLSTSDPVCTPLPTLTVTTNPRP